MKDDRIRTSFKITQETREQLDKIKRATNLPYSTIIEGMLADFMQQNEERIEKLTTMRKRAEEESSLMKVILERLDEE